MDEVQGPILHQKNDALEVAGQPKVAFSAVHIFLLPWLGFEIRLYIKKLMLIKIQQLKLFRKLPGNSFALSCLWISFASSWDSVREEVRSVFKGQLVSILPFKRSFINGWRKIWGQDILRLGSFSRRPRFDYSLNGHVIAFCKWSKVTLKKIS